MASAFPNTASPMLQPATAILIVSRGTHVPANYVRNPHQDPIAITVKQKGVPLLGVNKQPFTVAHVAEERRWAITYDGEVMDQVEFEAELSHTRLEYYQVLRVNGHPQAQFAGNIDREHKPRVERYVAFGVDPLDDSKLIDIGFDEHATDGAIPDHFVDGAGEVLSETRLDSLCKAYHDPRTRKALTPREITEVEAELGVSSSEPDGIAAKLEMLTELRESGDISDEKYIAKVAALTGTGGSDSPPAPSAPEPEPTQPVAAVARQPEPAVHTMLKTLCNAEAKGKRGKRMHEMNCNKCKDIRAQAEAVD